MSRDNPCEKCGAQPGDPCVRTMIGVVNGELQTVTQPMMFVHAERRTAPSSSEKPTRKRKS